MNAKWLGLCLLGLGLGSAASCAMDERDIHLSAVALGPSGQDAGGLGGANLGPAPSEARLDVAPTSIALGSVTTGFASRARLMI